MRVYTCSAMYIHIFMYLFYSASTAALYVILLDMNYSFVTVYLFGLQCVNYPLPRSYCCHLCGGNNKLLFTLETLSCYTRLPQLALNKYYVHELRILFRVYLNK